MCPIPCEDMLGAMSDQYPAHDILAYYSTGCKAYVLKLRHKVTGTISYVVKAKGITIDTTTQETINFDTFKVSPSLHFHFFSP